MAAKRELSITLSVPFSKKFYYDTLYSEIRSWYIYFQTIIIQKYTGGLKIICHILALNLNLIIEICFVPRIPGH